MFQLLAAIPTIFNAVGKVTDLFKKGKETVEAVTGKTSVASTPEELRAEVESLPPEEQNRWVEVMSKQVDMYAKQNERLAIEIGLVDENITKKLGTEAANKIAKLRMTTRPWTVRWMVHYVLFPFYLVAIDVVQNVLVAWFPFLKTWGVEPFNVFAYVFGVMNLPSGGDASAVEKIVSVFTKNGGPTTFAGQLYIESIPWVVAIILGYMGLREIGKAKGHKDAAAPLTEGASPVSVVSKALTQGVGLVGNIRNWFKK